MVLRACREAGISRASYYQLRRRYLAYGEAGLRPRPHPPRPSRRLGLPLVDAIVSYAITHPTEGERSIALVLGLARFGSWTVSHGGVRGVLRRAGLGRRLARLAAAERLSAASTRASSFGLLRLGTCSGARERSRAQPSSVGSERLTP